MTSQANLEKAKRLLLAKRRRIVKTMKTLAFEYASLIKDEMQDKPDFNDDSLWMKKVEVKEGLNNQSQEHQKNESELQLLSEAKERTLREKIFERNDLNNIIAYLISVIEGTMVQELHDEKSDQENFLSLASYYPCFVVGNALKSFLVNQDNFPCLENFMEKVLSYKAYKYFKYSYPLEEPLTYEELFNLANDFLDDYFDVKPALKK